MSRCGDPCGAMGTRRPGNPDERSRYPNDASRRCVSKEPSRRLAAGERWHDTGLVFTTAGGTEMDAANVRRDFRRALGLVPGVDASEWTPRELRHSFVSVLSDAGVPVEQISQWLVTAVRRLPNWSTGTSCGRCCRRARRSWIGCSMRTVDKQIDKQA